MSLNAGKIYLLLWNELLIKEKPINIFCSCEFWLLHLNSYSFFMPATTSPNDSKNWKVITSLINSPFKYSRSKLYRINKFTGMELLPSRVLYRCYLEFHAPMNRGKYNNWKCNHWHIFNHKKSTPDSIFNHKRKEKNIRHSSSFKADDSNFQKPFHLEFSCFSCLMLLMVHCFFHWVCAPIHNIILFIWNSLGISKSTWEADIHEREMEGLQWLASIFWRVIVPSM